MEPYIPTLLPLNTKDWNWPSLAKQISNASRALAYFDGVIANIINPSIFLSPLETKEAVLSSKIEGTITTVDEVMRFEANMKPESNRRKEDIQEVLNYRSAMRAAKEWLDKGLPMNNTLIGAIQAELMQGVRGANKQPGRVRKEQNWIGPPGCEIEQASYIPPEPLNLDKYLNNLVEYINLDDQEKLIQCAFLHAQFELIHPFLDGNGRSGRILIPLFLWQKGMIQAPVFYISEYLEAHRDAYYYHLNNISRNGQWENWVNFFLEAIAIQAEANANKAKQVLALYQDMKVKLAKISQSPNVIKILDALFVVPIFEANTFMKVCGLTRSTTNRILNRLKNEGILITLREGAGTIPETLAFQELMDLL
jgi:Fic family protein